MPCGDRTRTYPILCHIVFLILFLGLGGIARAADCPADGSQNVLVVDDDGGASYETYFTTALDSGGYTYFVCHVESQNVTGAVLTKYMGGAKGVIWFTGSQDSYISAGHGDVRRLHEIRSGISSPWIICRQASETYRS